MEAQANEPAPEVYEDPEDFEERGTDAQLTALYAALAKARSGFKTIVKDRDVLIEGRSTYRFTYADFGTLFDATTEALSANGLAFLSPFTRITSGIMVQRAMLTHADGARLIFVFKVPANDGDMKQTGGLQTYLMRYAYRSILALPGGEDLDEQPEASRGEQKATATKAGANGAPAQERPKAAPQSRPTPQPQAPAQTASPAVAQKLGELKEAMRACGYTGLEACSQRVLKALQGEVVKDWHLGNLSAGQHNDVMTSLMNERAQQLSAEATGK